MTAVITPADEADFQPFLTALTAALSITPAPVPPGIDANRPPIWVNGVYIGLPVGVQLSITAGTLGYGEEGPPSAIERGESRISWNSKRVLYSRIAPEDEATFQPFLDALKSALARAGAQ